jgi:AraC-like DNA-binding protein
MRNKLKWINLPTAFLFLIAFLSWARCAKLIKPAVLATSGFFLLFGFSQVISYAQGPYIDETKEMQWQPITISKQDILNKAIGTLDLGEYTNESSAIRPNFNAQGGGLDYRRQSNGTLITLSPKYSEQNGFAFGGVVAGAISKNAALGLLLNVGAERKEWLVNAGLDIDDRQRVIASLGQLRQKLDFTFLSGVDRSQITQNNGAFSYQFLMGRSWLNSAELNAYISDTQSIQLTDKNYYTDTSTLYELWSDSRRIAGGRVQGLQARMVLTPSAQSALRLGFGGERLNYDVLVGKEKYLRATGSAELNQQFANGYNLAASANFASSQNKFALGLSKTFNEGYQLGMNLAAIRGRDNTFDDNQITLNFTQFLGLSSASALAFNPDTKNLQALSPPESTSSLAKNDASQQAPLNQSWLALSDQPKPQWISSLVNAVAKKPSFLPTQVNAKVDTTATPTRKIAIDKTQLPLGSVIDKVSGLLTVPIQISGLDVPVSSIASVTKNAGAFNNSGQFALSGSTSLVINPSLITQPTVSDTYVVTMNNATGGGTTLATMTVSHGSSKIDSVVISSGTITTVLSGFAALNKTYGESAFTLTQPTSNNASGAFTYTSSNLAVATISGTTVTIVGAGTATITASQAANGNYSSATTTATLTVGQASQASLTLTASPTSITAVTGTSTLSTTGGNGTGLVSYSVTAGDCTISGSTLTAGGSVGVNVCRVTATKALDANYLATTSAAVDMTVTAIGTVATPAFSTSAGAVAYPTTITISSATAGVQIYYTTDGTTPTTASTNQATTALVINAAVTVKAIAVKAGYTDSAVAAAAYTQAQATTPSAITLAIGSSNPVGGVSNVAIPAAGATDTSGAVSGWVSATADKIKFTVADVGTALSTITVNGGAYTSGADYAITAASTLTVVVTTAETGKTTAVRTFTIAVTALPTPTLTFATPTSASVTLPGSLTNAASSSLSGGSYGAISYSSSNTAVATVDPSTGAISPVATGAATITATQAAVSNVNQQATQSYTLTVSSASFGTVPASIDEGSVGTFNVVTTNVPNGTTLYWTVNHSSTANADFTAYSGSFTVSSNAGAFTISPAADSTTEGAETFTVSIRSTSISGTVLATSGTKTVNDTSINPTFSTTGLIINYDASNFSNGASTWTNLGTGGATYNGVVTGSLSLTGTSPAAISIGGNGNPQTKYIDTNYVNNDAAWTIEIIAKALSVNGSGDSLLRKDSAGVGQSGWWFGAQGNTWFFRNQTSGANTNRLVITFGSDGKIWVDGVLKNTITGTENNTNSIKIITGITGNTWEISRFKYYDRTLSGTEISDNASKQKTELGF